MRKAHGVDPVAEKKKAKKETELPATAFNFSRDVERNIFECRECNQVFSSQENRDIHERIHNQHRPFKCRKCPATFKKHVARKMHERTCQIVAPPPQAAGTGIVQPQHAQVEHDDDDFRIEKSALKGVARSYILEFSSKKTDLYPRMQQTSVNVMEDRISRKP